MIGNWAGTGTFKEPTGQESKWTAKATAKWVLNNHFVQEDWWFKFDGMDVPVTWSSYIGWDREGKRYVRVMANNTGVVVLNELQLLPDGTWLQFMHHAQGGMPYTERARTKIDGDSITMKIDMIIAEGDSLTVIDAKMKRSDEEFEVDWGEDPFMGATPNEQMKRVGVLRGQYQMKGEMVMIPGQPALGISGTDTFQMVWGGNVMHGRTDGFAEGAPDAYESHAFWGWDPLKKCIRAVYVSNMGEVGEMEMRWVENGIVSTAANTMNGQPALQRFTMKLGRKGGIQSVQGTTVIGTMEPFTSFKATYKKQR